MAMTLIRLCDVHAIARLGPEAAIPGWADGPGVVSITRTGEELSILCPSGRVPPGVRAETGWLGYRFAGTFDFAQTGVAAAILAPLAAAEVPVLLISSFDTDYLFLKAQDAARAERALRDAGHEVA